MANLLINFLSFLQLAYLEKLRSDRFYACATVLQKNIRRFVYRQRYVRMRDMVIKLQAVTRRIIAQKELVRLRQERAAIIVQKNFRRFTARKEFMAKKDFATKLQRRKSRHYVKVGDVNFLIFFCSYPCS